MESKTPEEILDEVAHAMAKEVSDDIDERIVTELLEGTGSQKITDEKTDVAALELEDNQLTAILELADVIMQKFAVPAELLEEQKNADWEAGRDARNSELDALQEEIDQLEDTVGKNNAAARYDRAMTVFDDD